MGNLEKHVGKAIGKDEVWWKRWEETWNTSNWGKLWEKVGQT